MLPAETLVLEPDQTYVEIHNVVEYLEDPDHRLTIDEVTSDQFRSAFSPANGKQVNFGFTESAYWYRFSIENPEPTPQQQLLVLPVAWLDTISLYQPSQTAGYRVTHAGDREPFNERPYRHHQFLFNLDIQPGLQAYYLRLTSTQAFLAPIELWDKLSFWEYQRTTSAYFGMFYGIMLVMFLYNLFIYFSTREPSYLFYCLYLVAFFVMNAAYNGFAFQYFWPDSPGFVNHSYSGFIFLFQITGLQFARVFLETRERLPVMDRILKRLIALMAASWFISAWISTTLHHAMAVHFVFIYAPVVAISGVLAFRVGFRAARFFIAASMATLIGAFITALTAAGYLPYQFLSFHAAEFGLILDVILLSLALADRINDIHAQQEAAEREMLQEKVRTTLVLEQAKTKLELTVRHRTIELAMAKETAERLARTDELTGISNRRYFEETALLEFERATRYATPLALITFDIDHFKQINDQFGHSAGDEVIRVTALTASECVRSIDFTARIGGEEFVVLLPGITLQEAQRTAERIRRRIDDAEVMYQSNHIRFTASFGVAEMKADDRNFETMLQRADYRLYQSKDSGRNQVTSSGFQLQSSM
jgi:diguanylate cyclase (GGDEF)-like protein